MNADDRLSFASLGRVEGGNRIVEGSHVADVCPQPANPKPLDELTQLGAIGYDAEVENRLTAASAPRADDVRAGLTCELARHRTDYAGRTVHEDALPRVKAAVLEQPLPRRQPRHHEGRAHREINVARQRCEVACLDGHILR